MRWALRPETASRFNPFVSKSPPLPCPYSKLDCSPRQGDSSDEVRLRGDPKLVAKVKAELENAVAALQDRVVLAVEVPAGQHRALIGRGGQHLNNLQDKHSVQVQFPGSRSYHQVGQPENDADFSEVDPANIVKVSGSKAAVAAAIKDLTVSHDKCPSIAIY